MNFAQLIKAHRAKTGMTLEEVADAAGMSKSHMHGLENGDALNPGLYTCVRLSVALGVPVSAMAAAILESNERPS